MKSRQGIRSHWKFWGIKILWILARVALGAYLIVCGYFFFIQERFLFYPAALPPDYRFDFAQPFEEVTWKAGEATLHALHFRAAEPRGVVLFWHGQGGNLTAWGGAAEKFLSRGYDVLMPDYRGYGKSTGRIVWQTTLLSDADRAYEYLLEHYPEEQIVVYGQSLGTGIAAYSAAHHHPRLLILETPYYSGVDHCRRLFSFLPCALILKYPLRTDQWVQQADCPIYLFHGTADGVIAYDSSVQLQALIPERGQLITFEGGHHTDLSRYSNYVRVLDEILAAGPQDIDP